MAIFSSEAARAISARVPEQRAKLFDLCRRGLGTTTVVGSSAVAVGVVFNVSPPTLSLIVLMGGGRVGSDCDGAS